MRISDWSSDVCSSDLFRARETNAAVAAGNYGDLSLQTVHNSPLWLKTAMDLAFLVRKIRLETGTSFLLKTIELPLASKRLPVFYPSFAPSSLLRSSPRRFVTSPPTSRFPRACNAAHDAHTQHSP